MLLSGLALLGGCAGGNPNINAAEDALENQNYEQALNNVNQAIAEMPEPESAEAYVLKGNILLQQATTVQAPEEHAEVIAEAAAAYDRAIELDPALRADVQGRRQFGYFGQMQAGAAAFNEAQDYDQAAGYFRSAAILQPDSAAAYLNAAYALINAGRAAEAIEPLEETVTRIEQPDSSDAQTYLILAQLYQQEERPEDAIELLEDVREDFPASQDLTAQLLNAYAQSGNTEQAMAFYAEAIEQEPDNPIFRYNYGSMLLEAERYDEATEQLRVAIELDPQSANAHYNLGAAYVNQAAEQADRIQEISDRLSEERAEMTEQEMAELEQELQQLNQQVRDLFQQAIEPLEQARALADDPAREQNICSTLFRAYVRTGQQQQAQAAAECAGIEEE